MGAEPRACTVGDMKGIAAIVLAAALAGGCATTPGAFTSCNPVMRRCNDADYPPLTAQLPAWPFTRLLMPIEYADAFQHAERIHRP